MLAAELHQQTGNNKQALEVYRRFVGYFPQPVEVNLEMRSKIAEILKGENDQKSYLNELKAMVGIDAAAGKARTPRTRYLAGKAALVLAEQAYDRFAEVRLVKPFEANLRKKKELMKATTQTFNKLLEYEVGEVTAAATFYLAEIYAHFSKALAESERPDGLNAQEMQEYELAIEEQAFPFEEKAIGIHEKNLELISVGIYNSWIDKSLERLAKFVPARYGKPEVPSEIVASLESYAFEIERPAPPAVPVAPSAVKGEAPAADPPAAQGEKPVSEAVPQANAASDQAAAAAPVEKPAPEAAVPQANATSDEAAAVKPRAKGKKWKKRKKTKQ
jgi:hypothetical protein